MSDLVEAARKASDDLNGREGMRRETAICYCGLLLLQSNLDERLED